MTLREIVEKLDLEIKSAQDQIDNEVSGGYASDMLSDVIANSKEGDIWITFQTHLNIIAVASLHNLAGIIIVQGRVPEEEVFTAAEEKEIPVLLTKDTTFEIISKLYELGISGQR